MSPGELISTLAALVAVLLLAVGLGRLARWRGISFASNRPLPGHAFAVRSTLSIDSRRRLLLVSCRGRELIVLTSPHGDSVLDWPASPSSGAIVSEAIGQ